jgi:peptidoglycan/LPS O-acetylase OafA/YrhL
MLKDKRSIEAGDLSLSGAIGNFYMRRALRIFPLYYAVIGIMYVLGSKTGTFIRGDIGYYLLYIPNIRFYYEQRWDGTLSHFWSLGVEEQFYLCWPFLFFFSKRKHVPAILVMMALASVGYKISLSLQSKTVFFHILLISCIYKFCMGALTIFYLEQLAGYFKTHTRFFHIILGFATISYVGVCLFPFNLSWLVKDLAVYFLFVYLLLYSLKEEEGPVRKFLSLKFMVYLGTISYGLYVFHLIVPWLVENAMNKANFLKWINTSPMFYPLCILVTIILSHVSYYYYEGLFLRFKSRFSSGSRDVMNKRFHKQSTEVQ